MRPPAWCLRAAGRPWGSADLRLTIQVSCWEPEFHMTCSRPSWVRAEGTPEVTKVHFVPFIPYGFTRLFNASISCHFERLGAGREPIGLPCFLIQDGSFLELFSLSRYLPLTHLRGDFLLASVRAREVQVPCSVSLSQTQERKPKHRQKTAYCISDINRSNSYTCCAGRPPAPRGQKTTCA